MGKDFFKGEVPTLEGFEDVGVDQDINIE